MQQEFTEERRERRASGPTARDVAAIIFRQKKILLVSFVVILLGVVLSGVLMPKYQAQMKILVRRERVDPVVTSQSNSPPQFGREEVTESELNSEVELLNSRDLLQKVVRATGLHDRQSGDEEVRIAKAVRQLANKLKIEPLRKSDVISVAYESSDPVLAAKVLNTLAGLYMEKHLEVHRPSGEFKFFDQQTEQYQKGLQLAEQRLTEFTRQHGTVSAQMERDITLQKLSEFEVSHRQTLAAVAETGQRIRALEQQQASLPGRLTTQVRTSDNPQLLQQMKSTLLNLELKRTELLTKYDPSYRLVQELDKQIADTRATIAAEEKAPLREQTTDQNPTSLWVNSEMAKARTDLSALKAKAAATNAILNSYRQSARELQESAVVQQNLLRAAKTAEENYLLYQRKEEEARINDALDQRGILNVAIAEQPTVPALPVRSSLQYGLLSILLAGIASLGMAFTSDFLDPSFRTPDEVTSYLGTPVLASIPKPNNPKPQQPGLGKAVAVLVAAVLIGGVLGAAAGVYAWRAKLSLLHPGFMWKPKTTGPISPAPPVQPGSLVATVPAPETNTVEQTLHEDLLPALTPLARDRVVVERHQTLAEISRRYLGGYNPAAVAKLCALNPELDPDHIEVGQKILLPAGARAAGDDRPETPRKAQ